MVLGNNVTGKFGKNKYKLRTSKLNISPERVNILMYLELVHHTANNCTT